ncbi:MAG: response regulator [Desulfuromonadales bacterium]
MSKKLLLADDSITIQKVIGITFANEDYALDIVDNGDDALEKAKADRPDLILADVYMPGKNGYELCEAVKADENLAAVPVLLLTGTFEPFDEERARAAGAEDWIAKPFESQALIDKVEDLLAKGGQAPQAQVAQAPIQTEAAESVATAASAAEPQPETGFEGDSDFESLLETDEDEPFDEPQTWASEPEQGEEESDFGEEFETSEEDLWGSVSLEEESLMDEFAEEEPAGEDLWGSLNDELAVTETEPETDEAPSAPATSEIQEQKQAEDDVLPLEDTDILEAEDLQEDEEEGFVSAETAAESSSDDFLVTPAESLTEVEPIFEEPEPEPEEEVSDEPQPAPATAPSPAASVEQQVQALSDEDLNRIVEQVATRVLEKIAWEVVPDLAESLIKEEIRKIKEGGK